MKTLADILHPANAKSGASLLMFALLLAGGFSARAQSNSVPGDMDYEKFSAFIAARNIFDPARSPHYTPHHSSRPTRRVSTSAPTFTLVGTMSYEKGSFAFFSGNQDELKKILTVAGGIVGYTVTEITATGVKIMGADKKEIALKIGDRMQQGNSGWQLLEAGDDAAGSGMGSDAATSGASPATSPDSATAAPPPNLGNNSVLERLRKLKEQEN